MTVGIHINIEEIVGSADIPTSFKIESFGLNVQCVAVKGIQHRTLCPDVNVVRGIQGINVHVPLNFMYIDIICGASSKSSPRGQIGGQKVICSADVIVCSFQNCIAADNIGVIGISRVDDGVPALEPDVTSTPTGDLINVHVYLRAEIYIATGRNIDDACI